MRQDMHKVLCERPRYGGDRRSARRRVRTLEDHPAHESMRRSHVLARNDKSLSDHFGPLRRFLRKQAGRPWDRIYSEICERHRAGSILHEHVRMHVKELVEFNVRAGADRSPRRIDGGELRAGALYVDRRTGILRLAKARRGR